MKHIAHKKLAVLLRTGLMIAALVCGAIFFWFLPQLGHGIALADPEYAWAFWPCLIFAWLFAVPVFWAMAALWAVFGRIGRGDAFCMENARAMATVSRLAFFDAVLVPAGVITLALLGAGSPGMTVIAREVRAKTGYPLSLRLAGAQLCCLLRALHPAGAGTAAAEPQAGHGVPLPRQR